MSDAKYRIEKLRERKEREIFLATIEMKEKISNNPRATSKAYHEYDLRVQQIVEKYNALIAEIEADEAVCAE